MAIKKKNTKTASPKKSTAKKSTAVKTPAKKTGTKKTAAATKKPAKSKVAPAKSKVGKSAKAPAKAKKIAKPAAKTTAAPKKTDAAFSLASAVVAGILDRKGENIVCLDLRKIENAVCDYFIICEGNSNIQVEAIADSVEDTVKKTLKQRPYRSEGWENALWILIDYVDVVVHVFQRETRQFYNLESLWADAEEVRTESLERRA
jgi:ribosome-associated protein